MHPTLQAEVRLTRKLVQTSCRQCNRRCESPRRFFHRSRDLRSSQGARNDAESPPTPPPSEPTREAQNKHEITPAPPSPGFALPAAVTKHFFNQGGPPSEGTDQPASNAFYGSSANRRQRARASKADPVATTPDWFQEYNVTLHGEGKPHSWQQGERLIEPTTVKPDSQETQSPDGNATEPSDLPSPPQTEVEGQQTNARAESNELHAFGATQEVRDTTWKKRPFPSRYYIEAAQDAEIMHTIKGSIKAPEKREYQDEPALRTTHLLLHYTGRDGHMLLDEYVRNAAARLQCDLVTLDVQDIAELISTAQKGPEITQAARMMSYDVLYPKGKDSLPEPLSMESSSVGRSLYERRLRR